MNNVCSTRAACDGLKDGCSFVLVSWIFFGWDHSCHRSHFTWEYEGLSLIYEDFWRSSFSFNYGGTVLVNWLFYWWSGSRCHSRFTWYDSRMSWINEFCRADSLEKHCWKMLFAEQCWRSWFYKYFWRSHGFTWWSAWMTWLYKHCRRGVLLSAYYSWWWLDDRCRGGFHWCRDLTVA